MQKRIGKNEKSAVAAVLKKVRSHVVFKQDRKRNETFFNHRLYRDVKAKVPATENRKIWAARLVGETFRPEFFLTSGKASPLLCAECKKLTDQSAKSRFKEGLSQALLYANEYKTVLLVFYDYTTGAKYSAAFANKKGGEARLAAQLLLKHRIHVMFMVPQ